MRIDEHEARARLPLPALIEAMGYGDRTKGKTLCPLHSEKTPSFSVYRNGDSNWHYKCFGCGASGSEPNFVAAVKGVAIGEAFRIWGEMAGVATSGSHNLSGGVESLRHAKQEETALPNRAGVANPPAQSFAPLTEAQITHIAEWRGCSREFVAKLAAQGAIGTLGANVAFPLSGGGYHYRVKDGSWRYSPGAKAELFEIGSDPLNIEAHVFESQWDAMAAADALGPANASYIATRGAANAKLLAPRLADWPGRIYVWPQHDPPGDKWTENVWALFPQCKVVTFPQGKKDLNAWLKAGATRADLDAAIRAASPPRSRPADISAREGAADNLPVPVLAELAESCDGNQHGQTPSGEARESTHSSSGVDETSRGGQSLSTTLDAIAAFLARYVTFSAPEQADVVALWIAHAHIFTAFRFSPYLHICSPEKRSGKSRLLECIQLLVPRPELMVRPSEAVLFRTIEHEKPTLLLDEIDTIFSATKDDNAEGLRAVLNAGFQSGASIPRCIGATNEIARFSVFCPKVIAGIGRIPDTVHDRSIDIKLNRQTSEKKAQRFRMAAAELQSNPLREALQQWSGFANAQLAAATPHIPEGLTDRQADMLEPLLAIAESAGTDWAERGAAAIVALCSTGEDQSVGVQLLSDLREIFTTKDAESLSTAEILAALIEVESADAPWPTWFERDLKHGNTRGPANKLARILGPFGIKPRKVSDMNEECTGYWRRDCADAFTRYLPPLTMTNTELPF